MLLQFCISGEIDCIYKLLIIYIDINKRGTILESSLRVGEYLHIYNSETEYVYTYIVVLKILQDPATKV